MQCLHCYDVAPYRVIDCFLIICYLIYPFAVGRGDPSPTKSDQCLISALLTITKVETLTLAAALRRCLISALLTITKAAHLTPARAASPISN